MARIGMTRAQCRAARNAVGLSQKDLAKAADVSVPVVQEFEGRAGRVPMEKNLRDMRGALEQHGVQFRLVADGVASITFKDDDARPTEQADGDEATDE